MTQEQFDKLQHIRKDFKKKVEEFNEKYPQMKDEILGLYHKKYDLKKAFIYNRKLDDLKVEDNIKYIWVTDNPGFNEALQERYAVGSSGKGAKNFMETFKFVKNYDKEVLVLNKSCLHTRITNDLKKLKNYKEIIDESQIYMAQLTADLLAVFNCPLWILGISNLNNLFSPYTNKLINNINLEETYLYYHFSQGQFKKIYNKTAIDNPSLSPKEICKLIGVNNRKRLKS